MIRSLYRNLCVAGCLTLAAALALPADLSAQTPAPAAEAAATPAAAETPKEAPKEAPKPAAGDAERGKALTYTCLGCHGVTGYKNAYPSYSVPKIAGQSNEYLLAALNGYKQGTRKHPTMQAQSQSFSDQDIADIAAYLSSLKKK